MLQTANIVILLLGLGDKMILIWDCDKNMSVMMINFGHFHSIWIDLTAEINTTTASQPAVFGLHVKVFPMNSSYPP